MVTSKFTTIDNAAVARTEEIQTLSHFLSPYHRRRSFTKALPQALKREQTTRPAFHHLRDELGLLLGIAGSNLVLNSWDCHQLDLHESDPALLRPALLKLFSTAARIAAPRGATHALKSILQGFESTFFPISPVGKSDAATAQNHRFTLLALIQTGRGADLLSHTGVTKSSVLELTTSPPVKAARNLEQERLRLRREFLFESSCRSKSWTEAYRQSRLLSYGTPRPQLTASIERRFAEVYRKNMDSAASDSKKKQILSDIARLPAEHPEQPKEFTLRAVSAVAVSCRPGEDEQMLCRLLSPSDPRWRISLRRLYRHRPLAETWTSTFGKLWQQEPSLRPYTRMLFSLIRFSRRRAELAQAVSPPLASSEVMQPGQWKARLERACQEVKAWETFLEPLEHGFTDSSGARVIKLRKTLREHIVRVSHDLGLMAPDQVCVVPRFDEVIVRRVSGISQLVLSPVLLSTREGEARFLIARALFRHAAGLSGLEDRGRAMLGLEAMARRAAAHAEWNCHVGEALSFLNDSRRVEADELQVALEELYWTTGDAVYSRLCEVLANRCWCPRAEMEADIFAHRYCDMIDATYGVLAGELGCLPLYRTCESQGLKSLLSQLGDYPGLVLRLQSLWMSGTEEVQKKLTR